MQEDLKTSQAGLDIIKRFEDEAGFLAGRCTRLKAYRCSAGVYTIGWGHTRNVHEGMTCTPEQADAWLLEDVAKVEKDLKAILGCKVTQGQWDALVSLGFNLRGGARMIPIKAPRFWKALHAGDKQKAVIELIDINKVRNPQTGKLEASPGLTRRRQEEAKLFFTEATC